ncbi:MAG: transposase [Deltaproteobacteria bacterium]|nr:transposase [Deltaproteobacteria bacterium]
MVSLLILKQLYNLSDETIVERWIENPYFQFLVVRQYSNGAFPVTPRIWCTLESESVGKA